ncbi:MAG TPA: lysylphosphatidylglycerol synthase domain-containing protein, partial [Blastocatellia bacterium]
ERVRGLLTQFLLGMRAFQHGRRAVSFTVLAVVIWLMDALVAVWVANALNLQLAFPEALVLLAALGLASAAPSTPGYVGVYQFVAVTILAPFGFSRNQSLAYILTFQAVCYVVVLSLGAVGLWQLSERRSPTSAQPVAESLDGDLKAALLND